MDAAQLRSGSPDRPPSTSASGNATSYPGAAEDGNAGGAKVWVLVLLFALLLLPFLPSAVRRGGTPWGGGGISLKSGWDVVNLCLVLFAILCGLLRRGGDGESAPAAGKKEPAPGMDSVWESYSSGTQQQQEERHAGTGGIRRMKSTSSYPELRLGSDGVWALASPDAAWRFRDDADLEYRPRRPERAWDVHPRAPEVKTIPVDTFVERPRGEPPRRRRRNVDKSPNMAQVEEERPQAPPRSSSAEAVATIPEQETVEVEEVRNPSRAPRPRPEELDTEIAVEEVRIPPPSTASRSKKNKRNGSVGGAKELASAIALFYQKKRKSITMKAKRRPHHHHHSDDHPSPPSSEASASPDAAPPPSIFSNLFKNKKGSMSRRIHSVVAPPPPPTRRSVKPPTPPSRPAPAAPPPPPARPRPSCVHAHTHGHSQQPPMYPRRVYYTYYPPSPPPPPPPPVSEGEEDAPSATASPAPAYCASPDVNAKADRFIESFREGLKLEKLNSYREKWQRQIRQEAVGEDEDGEFMVIGSLFGDDDISLPETPATAAVAVGF
jgi:hypothetical protein